MSSSASQPFSSSPASRVTASRADGSVLHVDFECYEDGIVGLLNAGVRWVGHPFTASVKQKIVEITNDTQTAYSGLRAAHVFTDEIEQQGRITLQCRAGVSHIKNEIVEFVFRPVRTGSADIDEFTVISCIDRDESPVGIALIAHGSDGKFAIDVETEFGQRHYNVVCGLPQDKWIRSILCRRAEDAMVDLWIGPPNAEEFVGSFKDIDPEGQIFRIEFGDLSSAVGKGSGYWDDIRVGRALPIGAPLHPPEVWTPIEPAPSVSTSATLVVSKERQLFVDDFLVESLSGVHRRFHNASKHLANPVLQPQTPCELQTLCTLPQSVLRDGETGEFRCWYGIWGVQVKRPTYEALAISRDGVEWHRPNLGLVEFAGSRENNLIREGRQFRIIHDPHDPDPQRRYKAIIRDAGFLASFSPDGLRWNITSPVLEQAYDASSVHWDPVGKKWIGSCKIWRNGKRARGYTESPDFLHWADTQFLFAADALDAPSDQTYSLNIIYYESVFIGLLKMYHLDSDRCDIQIAFSRDAKHWDRSHRLPFIANGLTRDEWDYGNLDPTSTIHPVGDELWFFYSGRRALHNEVPNDGAMGVARLRKDGFASLEAADEPGVFLTKPVVLRGRRLFVNAAADGGEIRVEILEGHQHATTADEADVPIFPFTKLNSIPVLSDSVAHEVFWKNSTSLAPLRGRPVRLRFSLRNAKLFSFWVE